MLRYAFEKELRFLTEAEVNITALLYSWGPVYNGEKLSLLAKLNNRS